MPSLNARVERNVQEDEIANGKVVLRLCLFNSCNVTELKLCTPYVLRKIYIEVCNLLMNVIDKVNDIQQPILMMVVALCMYFLLFRPGKVVQSVRLSLRWLQAYPGQFDLELSLLCCSSQA